LHFKLSSICFIASSHDYPRFLYQGREVSYSSVLHRSISARREALYKSRGFDIDRWLELVGEAKEVRSEIGRIAQDYDKYRGEPRSGGSDGSSGQDSTGGEPAEGHEEKEASRQGKTEAEKVLDEARGDGTPLTEENART
jgi:calcium uniporter protein, mitochondrial